MLSMFRRSAYSAMVRPILTSLLKFNPPHQQRALARYLVARKQILLAQHGERTNSFGAGAAQSFLALQLQELAQTRRIREAVASHEGEPDLAALLLEEYFLVGLVSTDQNILPVFHKLFDEWCAELGDVEPTDQDRARAKTGVFQLKWLHEKSPQGAVRPAQSVPRPPTVALSQAAPLSPSRPLNVSHPLPVSNPVAVSQLSGAGGASTSSSDSRFHPMSAGGGDQ